MFHLQFNKRTLPTNNPIKRQDLAGTNIKVSCSHKTCNELCQTKSLK